MNSFTKKIFDNRMFFFMKLGGWFSNDRRRSRRRLDGSNETVHARVSGINQSSLFLIIPYVVNQFIFLKNWN